MDHLDDHCYQILHFQWCDGGGDVGDGGGDVGDSIGDDVDGEGGALAVR